MTDIGVVLYYYDNYYHVDCLNMHRTVLSETSITKAGVSEYNNSDATVYCINNTWTNNTLPTPGKCSCLATFL